MMGTTLLISINYPLVYYSSAAIVRNRSSYNWHSGKCRGKSLKMYLLRHQTRLVENDANRNELVVGCRR